MPVQLTTVFPNNRREKGLSLTHVLAFGTSAMPEVAAAIQSCVGVSGPLYLSTLDDLQSSRAALTNSRDTRRKTKKSAYTAMRDFISAAELNGGEELKVEILRELGGKIPSHLQRLSAEALHFALSEFINRVEARGLKVPGDRFQALKDAVSALESALFEANAAEQRRVQLSADVKTTEDLAVADFRKLVHMLIPIVGEDRLGQVLYAFPKR